MSIASLLNRANGEEGRKAITGFVIRSTQSTYGQYADDIDPRMLAELGLPTRGAQGPVLPATRAENDSKPPTETPVDKAAAVFETPKARQTETKSLEEADAQWLRYATSETQGRKFLAIPRQGDPRLSLPSTEKKVEEPGWAEDMGVLGLAMRDTRLPAEARVQARSKLQEIMRNPDNLDAAYYAKYLLGQDE